MINNTSPNINYFWADLMVEELIRNGVEYFCISPGSRSSPLTLAVANNPKAKSLIHYDERGSAFRALGITCATRKPTVVITTSGTAAANVFPAVIEASKKKVPLIILTADRPPELRFTGAHQTIDQNKIYGEYVRWFFDLPCPTKSIAPEFVLTTIDQAVSRAQGELGGPVHINCMFREPLVGATGGRPKYGRAPLAPTYRKAICRWEKNKLPYTQYVPSNTHLDQNKINTLVSVIQNIKSGIIVVGKLSGPKDQKSVLKLAEKLNWPIFADISSGLRLGSTHKNIIHYFDQILLSDKYQKQYQPDGILHLGGRITSKRWYEYIETTQPKQYMMVLDHPLRNDPLHNVTTRVQCSVKVFCDSVVKRIKQKRAQKFLAQLQILNTAIHGSIDNFFYSKDILSEPQTARLITQLLPADNALFISSSMPIREINSFGTSNGSSVIIGSNRGASGIDGVIASATGFAMTIDKLTTLLIGDLAFLYDLNSLSMIRELKTPMVIVVQNNNGGGIFSFLPISTIGKNFEKYFGTPHHLTFHGAADLFDLNYAQASTPQEFTQTYSIALKSRTSTIIEVPTERAGNLDIHKQLQTHIKKTINSMLSKGSHHDKNHIPVRAAVNLDNSRKLRRYQVR